MSKNTYPGAESMAEKNFVFLFKGVLFDNKIQNFILLSVLTTFEEL